MKKAVIEQILKYLEHELAQLTNAAQAAHSAAIDEQSIAETQYDTLAIEAGYLAQGQSLRAEALAKAIAAIKALPLMESFKVELGALVQLSQHQANHQWLFIAPAAAGFNCQINGETITVITPSAPMAKALMGKALGDEVTLKIAQQSLEDEIITLR
ncbi:GreA/GreB family elongation factor [Thalassotalea sp. G2M2-11]|uniref:GreA/GreB family elongation factor n=1 Tax=Thalassotalea sp. G2M2-11 TaxID=2787627 RepID=UPI0019D0931D|nr:GreA/GreB family elongation factor [Thalassotalea sp. G2M2-11]